MTPPPCRRTSPATPSPGWTPNGRGAGIGEVSPGGAHSQRPGRMVPAGAPSSPLSASISVFFQRPTVPLLSSPTCFIFFRPHLCRWRWSKGVQKCPPLDESVATHLYLPAAIRWKVKVAHSSKPCKTTSTLARQAYSSAGQAASVLHSMAVLQVFQAKLLCCMNESGPDPAAFRELRSAANLALSATKTMAQAIGRSMASPNATCG